jgi:hypothetical protein
MEELCRFKDVRLIEGHIYAITGGGIVFHICLDWGLVPRIEMFSDSGQWPTTE